MKCGVHKTVSDKNKVNDMDIGAVYELAKSHYIQAYIAWVLESMKDDYPLSDTWKDSLNQAIHYRMIMDVHTKNLFSFLEEKKCWYMQLKGYIIKDFYPAYGIRQMADIDILFDPQFRHEVKDYFVSNGFKIINYKKKMTMTILKTILIPLKCMFICLMNMPNQKCMRSSIAAEIMSIL